jgi:hypothetical protein
MGAAQEANRALRELLLLGKETPENLRWMSVCGKDGVLTAAVKVLSLSLSLSLVLRCIHDKCLYIQILTLLKVYSSTI